MEKKVDEGRTAAAVIGGIHLVIGVRFERLADLSGALNCQSLAELVRRVSQGDPRATLAVLEHCVVSGNVEAVRKRLTVMHCLELGAAWHKLMLQIAAGAPA